VHEVEGEEQSKQQLERGIGMRKHLLVGLLAVVFAVALAAPAAAQDDNVSGLGSFEGAAGTIFLSRTSETNYNAGRYRCTDPTRTSSIISVAVADCCIAGDIFRASIFKGLRASRFDHTANVAQFTPGAPAFPPDVYSPNATIATSVVNVDVVATAGNSHPGGLPAGWTVRVITNGGGPVCALRQNKP
jgi:hypothetical protein